MDSIALLTRGLRRRLRRMNVGAVDSVAFLLLGVNHALPSLVRGVLKTAAVALGAKPSLPPGFAVFFKGLLTPFGVVGLELLEGQGTILRVLFVLPHGYEAETIACIVWAHTAFATLKSLRDFLVK